MSKKAAEIVYKKAGENNNESYTIQKPWNLLNANYFLDLFIYCFRPINV